MLYAIRLLLELLITSSYSGRTILCSCFSEKTDSNNRSKLFEDESDVNPNYFKIVTSYSSRLIIQPKLMQDDE